MFWGVLPSPLGTRPRLSRSARWAPRPGLFLSQPRAELLELLLRGFASLGASVSARGESAWICWLTRTPEIKELVQTDTFWLSLANFKLRYQLRKIGTLPHRCGRMSRFGELVIIWDDWQETNPTDASSFRIQHTIISGLTEAASWGDLCLFWADSELPKVLRG